MFTVYTLALIAFVSITLLPRSTFASCCYSFFYQPLQPSSPYYKLNNINGPPAYSLSLTTSSQYAITTPGRVYLALITFPPNFIISAIPTGCVSISINSVSCTSSGTDQLTVNFGNIFIVNGYVGAPLRVDNVVVNGEQCTCQFPCPMLTPLSTMPSPTSTLTATATIQGNGLTPMECRPYTSSSCPTPTMEPSPTPTDKDPSKINTGLIIGLVLALTLLIILAIICILRRHRKGAPFFFGIKRKRSGISMSRGGSGVSSQGVGVGQGTDIGNIESGYGRISSEIEPDFVVPSEKPPGDEEGSAAAMRTAEAVTRGLVNARKSSAGTIPHPPPPHAASSSAADAGSGSKANIATTPVNIPEVPESQQPEVNHFEDGRGRNLMESRNGRRSVNAITAIPDRHTLHQTSTEPLVISSVKAPIAAAPVASKDSRLNRAVSATSSRDGIQSASSPTHPTQEQKQRHQFRRIGSCSSSRFLRDNFLFRSSSSSARTPRASSTSMRGFITTIRPEHHQQQIRQRELEQEFEIEDQLDQQTSLRDDGQSLLPGFDHRSGMGLISNKDAFTNPGPPPPLPVSAQARSLLNNVATRSVSARLKRGNTQPIHIRAQPQRHRTSSTAQEHALKSEAHNPGLYGYM